MKQRPFLLSSLLVLAMPLALTSCDNDDVGDAMEDAADEAGDAMDDAGDAIDDAVDDNK